ncbi:MAG: HAD family phosphatase [Calditrichia bacterium]
MPKSENIKSLFLDVGGVLLTNGWDRHARKRAIKNFDLDEDEVSERHHLTFDTYEEGKLSLREYLDRLVFYKKRSFTHEDFKNFMFSQSEPHPEMIELIAKLRARHNLRIITVNNEGRELNEYRIRKFKLYEFADAFVSSSFVHFRKPDKDIFRIALDISQMEPENVIYIDDRDMFVEIARSLGIHGIHHKSLEETRSLLAQKGLSLKE